MRKTTWPGNWKVACQRCGFWFPSSDIRREWTGLLVCKDKCWEPKHPQLVLRVREEKSVPAFVSKEPDPPTFILVCDINGVSGFADMGTADCMQADRSSPTYAVLRDTLTNGHGGN